MLVELNLPIKKRERESKQNTVELDTLILAKQTYFHREIAYANEGIRQNEQVSQKGQV